MSTPARALLNHGLRDAQNGCALTKVGTVLNSHYITIWKPFAQAANWNFNRNFLGANCQSKYQHCVTVLQSGTQTNNRFNCKTARIIYHNPLLWTSCLHIEPMTSKVRALHISEPMKSKWSTSWVQPAADWIVDRENLRTRLCFLWKWRNSEERLS